VDCRPLVLDAVGGEEASRFLSPFWVGAPARGSAHGRPSGAHGVRRACCLLQCGSAYTSTGLSWKCNETFFTAMFKIQTPELADGRLAVFSPLNICSPGVPRSPKAQRRGNTRMIPRPRRLECFARLPGVVVSPFGRGQRRKSHSAVKKARNTIARLASCHLPRRAFQTRTTYRQRRHSDEASAERFQFDCPPLPP